MKIIHLSDLHLGKRVNEFSMIEDQKYILKKILNIIDEQNPDAVIIAGDVYDKPVPSTEAVALLDEFLVNLAKRQLQVLIISGNHDSAERLSFGSRLMRYSGIHVAPVYDGNVRPVTLTDEYGSVNFYMLPFIKPAHVRLRFPDEEISSYTDAVATAVKHMNINSRERNIIITHQLVTGASRCDSEDISVGGSDDVALSVFQDFDYVALGHLHGPQRVCCDTVRYCGTPLKYSFSEAGHKKSVTVLDIRKKGDINIYEAALSPLRDMRELYGSYSEITLRENYENVNRDDYLHITLTDEDDIPDAISKLRVIYPNIMKLDYDNTRTRRSTVISAANDTEVKSPIELFAEFFEKQNNREMSAGERDLTQELIDEIWRGYSYETD